MTALKDFPRLHLRPGGGADASASAGQARQVDPQDAEALRQIAAGHQGEWIAVVDEGVELWPDAMNLSPEPALLGAKVCIGYLSRIEMNGFARRAGLKLCCRDKIEQTGRLPAVDLSVPKFVGSWSSNADPKMAFDAGVLETQTRMAEQTEPPASAQDLALWGSLGADVRNGIWWLLGANLALLGPQDAAQRWAEAEARSDDPAELARWLNEIAREVRLERSIPVRPMSPEQSRSAKLMLSPWPASQYWTEFAEDCAKLGEDGAKLASDYLRALSYIWGPLPG